jgi:hypothetical protein
MAINGRNIDLYNVKHYQEKMKGRETSLHQRFGVISRPLIEASTIRKAVKARICGNSRYSTSH